jgi:hypothetical protein
VLEAWLASIDVLVHGRHGESTDNTAPLERNITSFKDDWSSFVRRAQHSAQHSAWEKATAGAKLRATAVTHVLNLQLE